MKAVLLYHPKSVSRIELLTLVPIAVYFVYFFYYGIDAPQFDDFQTAVLSVVTFDEAGDRLRWLLSQYGEHRIAYVRFVAIAVQRLTGYINFTWMGLIGNASLIGVVVVLYRWFREWKLERYFLPVPFILFQMNYYHNTFTAMMALQNLTVLFWALLTFRWVANGRGWRPWVALIPAVLAVYTSGNGLFVVLTAVLVLTIRRQWPQVAVWVLVGGGAVLAYFWGLHSLDSVKPNYSLSFMATHVPQLAIFTVFFSGSYFDLLPNVLMSSSTSNAPFYVSALFYVRLLLPFLSGLLLIVGSLVLIGRWFPTDHLLKRWQHVRLVRWWTDRFVYERQASVFLGAVLLFILLTAGVVALGRIDVGLAQSFAVRYKIYAPLLLIGCYAALLINIRQPERRLRFYRLLLPVSLFIGANSYVQNLNQIQTNKRVAFTGLHNMAVNRSWAVYGSFYGDIDSVMQTAIDRHMYQIDPAARDLFPQLGRALKRPCSFIDVQLDTDTTTLVAHLRVRHSQLNLPLLTTATSEGPYFVVYNSQREYLFPAQPDRNLMGNYESGFHCYLEQTSRGGLTPGLYKIAVMTNFRGHQQLYHTGHNVQLLAQR